MSKFSVVLPAAGRSRRFNDRAYKKPFAPLGGRAVWLHSAERFLSRPDVCQVILVIAAEDREAFHRKFGANIAILGVDLCEGGAERSDSIGNALELLSDEADMVAVHDAARPCCADKWIDAVFSAAQRSGAAILATPVAATLKRAKDDRQPPVIGETVERTGVWEAQTPQAFRRDWLAAAYATRGETAATDDAELVQRLGHPVELIKGSPLNLKITTKEDQLLAEQILKVLPTANPGGAAHPFADDDLWR
ncbi:MAG: 2-C-methyl-D-erythritol 4-phosphate cytidylyltransferase [Planctomycetota bacterium]